MQKLACGYRRINHQKKRQSTNSQEEEHMVVIFNRETPLACFKDKVEEKEETFWLLHEGADCRGDMRDKCSIFIL